MLFTSPSPSEPQQQPPSLSEPQPLENAIVEKPIVDVSPSNQEETPLVIETVPLSTPVLTEAEKQQLDMQGRANARAEDVHYLHS